MSNLPEDPDERRMFDDTVRMYGSPLKAIAASLCQMSKMHPQQGSLSKMLAIWSNECAKADEP